MNINVRTNISKDYGEDIEIIINTSNYTKEVEKITETLSKISNEIDVVIARKENEISVINVNDIIMFYSNEQSNYCKTETGDYIIKYKLYELEDLLPKKQFIRISNSTIINIQFVECFDVSTIGNIIVKLKNGITEYASKRRISRNNEIFKRKRGIVMKRVLKNIFKSITITCLVLEVVSTLYFGIYTFAAQKVIYEQEIIELGRNIRPETDEEINQQLGALVYVYPKINNFRAVGTILLLSILIGTVIGVTISTDEKSNKKVILTYFAMFFIIIVILMGYKILGEGIESIFPIENLKNVGIIIIIYSIIYGLIIVKKKKDSNKIVKIMNDSLRK